MNRPDGSHFYAGTSSSGAGQECSDLGEIYVDDDEQIIVESGAFDVVGNEEVSEHGNGIGSSDAHQPLYEMRQFQTQVKQYSRPRTELAPVNKEYGHPSKVLLTSESLRGNPKLFSHVGRATSKSQADRKKVVDLVNTDPPPRLESAYPGDDQELASMLPMFRIISESALRKASLSGADNSEHEHPGGSEVAIVGSLEECTEEIIEEQIVEEETELDEEQLRDLEVNQKFNIECEDVPGSSTMMKNTVPSSENVVFRPPMLTASEFLQERQQKTAFFNDWPLYWDRPIDYEEACTILTGMRVVPESKICPSVPQGFKDEGTFVVDLRTFPNRHDVGLDGHGVWGKPTGRARFYDVDSNGKAIRVDDSKGRLLAGKTYTWKCMCKRYEHPATTNYQNGQNRFIRKIFTALLPPEKRAAIGLAVVVYEWVGTPFEFTGYGTPTTGRPHNSAGPADGSKNWEAASFNNELSVLPNTCQAFFDDCPLFAAGAVDFGTASCIILGGIAVEPSKVCTRVPQRCREAGTFVVDIRQFQCDAELRRDGNGVWGKPAGHSRYYKVDNATGDAVRVDRASKLIEGTDYDIQILAKRYDHPSVRGRFVRKIYTGRSPSGDRYYHTCSHLAVITYYWKGEPEWFDAGTQNKVRVDVPSVMDEAVEVQSRLIGGPSKGPALLPVHGHLTKVAADQLAEAEECEVECEPDMPMPRATHPEAPPPTKRARTTMSSTPTPNPAPPPANAELDRMRAALFKRQFDNQERFSHILDRAEAFLERLERAAENTNFAEQVWVHSSQQDGVGVVHHDSRVVGEEGVVEGEEMMMDDDGTQYTTHAYMIGEEPQHPGYGQ